MVSYGYDLHVARFSDIRWTSRCNLVCAAHPVEGLA